MPDVMTVVHAVEVNERHGFIGAAQGLLQGVGCSGHAEDASPTGNHGAVTERRARVKDLHTRNARSILQSADGQAGLILARIP